MYRYSLLSLFAAVCMPSVTAFSEDFKALDSFGGDGNTKDVQVQLTAKSAPVTLGGYQFTSNVYYACQGENKCSRNLYGGPRFILQQGGTLKIDLKNKMPDMVEINPESNITFDHVPQTTNLHTHGLIVKPNEPAAPGGRYGDFVFVGATSSLGSSTMGGGTHSMGGVTMLNGGINFEIKIPPYKTGKSPSPCTGGAEACGEHPSGIFWFHPHWHELSKEQVSGGLSGMINVGRLRDYACLTIAADGTCADTVATQLPPMRHMMLKDIQLENLNQARKTADVKFDQDAGFCTGHTNDNLKGYCDSTPTNGAVTGKWFFNINGSVYPEWKIAKGGSEIWRIQNGSANITYDLRLGGASSGWNLDGDAGGMPFQLLALDGVGLGTSDPGTATPNTPYQPDKLQRRAILMPGSRIEILVSYRDPANCNVAGDGPTITNCPAVTPTTDKVVELANASFNTGGDNWPKLRLAGVTFKGQRNGAASTNAVALVSNPLGVGGTVVGGAQVTPGIGYVNPNTTKLCKTGMTRKLLPGERRRIYFGILTDETHGDKTTDPNWRPEVFVLGHSVLHKDPTTGTYTEIKEDGQTLTDGPDLQAIEMDDKSDLCVPYGVKEQWELVNVSPEVHNFHIHQNKFTIGLTPADRPDMRTPDVLDAQNLPNLILTKSGTKQVEHDTIVVPRGDGAACDGKLSPDAPSEFVKVSGTNFYHFAPGTPCRGDGSTTDKSGSIRIVIPFNRPENVGKYVYHCHILEHEDLGMMSSIRVLSDQELSVQ